MRGFGIFGAVAGLVFAFAATSVCAQTTPPAGQPLALLAGLRPPHEGKHKEARRVVPAKSTHDKSVHERTAAKTTIKTTIKTPTKTRHSRVVAHARHASAIKIATRHHRHHEDAISASAFAEEPPPQAAPTPPPAPTSNWPVVDTASSNDGAPPAADAAAAPVSASTAATPDTAATFPDPDASKVQTIKITAVNPASSVNPARPVAPASVPVVPTSANDGATSTLAPMQNAMAASANSEPAEKTATLGSASWIAQVLAALGGAVAAGAVAWFLIGGSGPVRTYG